MLTFYTGNVRAWGYMLSNSYSEIEYGRAIDVLFKLSSREESLNGESLYEIMRNSLNEPFG